MKILVITMNIGETAPGIVNERIIYGLSQNNDIDVATIRCKPTLNICKVNEIKIIKYSILPDFLEDVLVKIRIMNRSDGYADIHPRIKNIIRVFKGKTILDSVWEKRLTKWINDTEKKYDIVFSLISQFHFLPVYAGNLVSQNTRAKWALYVVDAIPPSKNWGVSNTYILGCKKMITRYFSKVDAIFSANLQMLNYQLSYFTTNSTCVKDVIFTPSLNKISEYPCKNKSQTFLYTGSIYGLRKVSYLLKAFQMLLRNYPNAKLCFVGTKLLDEYLSILSEDERLSVEILPYMNDLSLVYEKSCCLVDIDSYVDNDVFLSSKMVNYITINRPIISETGSNSPSRHLFKGIPSIIQCGHSSDELYIAMKKTLENIIDDFSDRKSVIAMFNLNNVINKLENNLKQIIVCRD